MCIKVALSEIPCSFVQVFFLFVRQIIAFTVKARSSLRQTTFDLLEFLTCSDLPCPLLFAVFSLLSPIVLLSDLLLSFIDCPLRAQLVLKLVAFVRI